MQPDVIVLDIGLLGRSTGVGPHMVERPMLSIDSVQEAVQVAVFEGSDMIEGTNFGHNAALDNLVRVLRGTA
jgi:hypothetical protein